MKNLMVTPAVFVLLTISQIRCATLPDETAEGKAVVISMSDLQNGCKELGSVDWSGSSFHSLSDAKTALKEKTAKLGGNVLRLENLSKSGGQYPVPTAAGTAYSCPKQN